MPQPGLFDLDGGYARLNEPDPLFKLNPIIDWEACREPLSVLRNKPRTRSAALQGATWKIRFLMPGPSGCFERN